MPFVRRPSWRDDDRRRRFGRMKTPGMRVFWRNGVFRVDMAWDLAFEIAWGRLSSWNLTRDLKKVAGQ